MKHLSILLGAALFIASPALAQGGGIWDLPDIEGLQDIGDALNDTIRDQVTPNNLCGARSGQCTGRCETGKECKNVGSGTTLRCECVLPCGTKPKPGGQCGGVCPPTAAGKPQACVKEGAACKCAPESCEDKDQSPEVLSCGGVCLPGSVCFKSKEPSPNGGATPPPPPCSCRDDVSACGEPKPDPIVPGSYVCDPGTCSSGGCAYDKEKNKCTCTETCAVGDGQQCGGACLEGKVCMFTSPGCECVAPVPPTPTPTAAPAAGRCRVWQVLEEGETLELEDDDGNPTDVIPDYIPDGVRGFICKSEQGSKCPPQQACKPKKVDGLTKCICQ